jgi:hypothetical protein
MNDPRRLRWTSKLRVLAACQAAGFVLLAGMGSAWADAASPHPPPVDLQWDATPACSDGHHVVGDILRILGDESGTRNHVVARVSVEKEEGETWRVTLVVKTDGGSRTRAFEAESCSAAADAVALILAIDVDPQVAMRAEAGALPERADATVVAPLPPAPAPPSALPPSTASAPSSVTPAPSSVNQAPRSSFRLPFDAIVGASLAADAGSLPDVGVGGSLALGARVGRLRLELDGTYWGEQTAVTPTGPAGAHFRLVSGNVRAAYDFRFGILSLGPLVDAGLEGMGAQGFSGTKGTFSPTEFWPLLGVGGLAAIHLFPHFALRLVLEAELPLFRPTFVVENPPPTAPTSLHHPSAAVGRALFGAEVDFR